MKPFQEQSAKLDAGQSPIVRMNSRVIDFSELLSNDVGADLRPLKLLLTPKKSSLNGHSKAV